MKILHLEDNAADAELIHQVIIDKWPHCRVKVIDNRSAFIAELPAGYDLILSDFSMASFTGLEALEIAFEKSPGIPFIFFSGTIGEDRALEALRAGASDYVLKDRPGRLIHSIERSMNDSRLRRERQIAEEQMHRVQRLENIGMLAAGIAHDFNNVLAPVLMGIPLLRSRLKAESDTRILDNIENSVLRGAGLVRQILGFANGMTGEPQLIQPKHLIRELVAILEQTFPKAIRIQDESEGGLWPLTTNPTQFHQILLNLCVNARDAMPDGGILRLRAANRQIDAMSAASLPGARPGPYLQIEVSDNGTGIAPEALEHIWDPFFTTKEVGRGTGLGLATVRGIVEGHQGVITVQTRPGHGSTFQIFLPATPGADAVMETIDGVEVPRGQGQLILVADDDSNLRDLTCSMLTDHGYRVLAAADGTEALALFAPRSLEFKMVITDLDMPGLDGFGVSKVVHALSPTVPILITSGTTDVDEIRSQKTAASAFLAKPFAASKLLAQIHKLLVKKDEFPWEV